jgi:hypothetical protein
MASAGRGPRTIVLLVLAVASLLGAAACAAGKETPQIIYITPTPGTTPLPSGVTPEPTTGPPTITTFLVESSAPDSRWKVTFKKPVVSGIADAAATKINDAITAKINGYISAFNGKGLPAVISGAGPSTLEGDYSIGLNSRTVISLRFTVLTYVSGAAHPAGQPGGITFSVSTGDSVALDGLFSDKGAALSKIAAACKSQLSSLLGSDLTWDGTASSFDFFAGAWVFTPAGLEFNFAQGVLASQAAGMPSATVPWSELKSLISTGSAAGEFAH